MNSTLKIKYLNNIYIDETSFEEKLKNIDIVTKYDYFVFNGNIGNPFDDSYKLFLEYYFEKIDCKKIFLICGDLEYSFDTYENVNNKIKSIVENINKNSNKLIFFENKCIFFKNITFIGCSLLNNNTNELEFIEKNIENSIKKYSEICLITFNKFEIPEKFKNTFIYHINSSLNNAIIKILLYN